MEESRACDALITKGPLKGLLSTGTPAGYERHRKVDEPACDACLLAVRERDRRRVAANREQMRVVRRRWEAANREKINEDQNRRRALNPEPRRESSRRWQAANPEKQRELNRKWRLANREKHRELIKSWKKENPEKMREYQRRRRASERGAPTIPFTVEQLDQRLSMFGYRCYLRTHCDGVIADTVDHVIPLARGGRHCLSNLRPACLSCNSAKCDRPLDALI